MKTLLGVFAVLMAACGTIAVAADGTWSSEGPYGGAVYRLYVNPATPSVLYASTRGGIFRSDDGGVSWVRKEAGLGGTASFAYAVAMDADAPATLWVVDSFGHFQRSTDGGDNWAPTGYNVPVDDTVAQIADVPGTTGKLFIATRLHGVLVSVDNGASFLPSNTGLPAGVPINNIAVDPNDPMRVIAGTFYSNTVDSLHPQSVYLSMDGGVTWNGTLAFPGPPATYQQVVDISFGAGTKVYASIGSLLFRSDDNGASWVGPLGTIHDVESVAADPANGDTVLIGGRYGVARSTDGGVTSTPLNTGLIVTGGMAATVTRITLHPNYPTTGQIWLGTTEAGIYFSASSGATWIDQNDGLAATEIRALAMFHDGSTHRMFAGYGDAFEPSPALFRGNNSGPGTPFSSWTPSNTNLDAYQIRSITIDPTTVGAGIGSTRMYATGRADYPNSDGPQNGGIYRSLDGGNTWATIDSGLPTTGSPPAANVGTVRSLVLDPRSCNSPPGTGPCITGPLRTLFASSSGRSVGGVSQFRIMKSRNGGDSWSSSEFGIPQPINPSGADFQSVLVVPIVINPDNPQVLYAGTAAGFDPAVVPVPTIQNGVFKSTDGGATWSFSSNGIPRRTGSTDTALDVLSLAINPVNPQELWCSIFDSVSLVGSTGGVYHSTDAGASWSNASTGLTSIDIRALFVDPSNPAVVYAAGGGTVGNPGGVYQTTDSGAHWHSISIGLPADAALALQVDPVDSRVLYAGTTSGVWSLTQVPDADADGVPDAIELAAPNGGDGNQDGIPDAQQASVGSLTSATTGNSLAGRDQAASANSYFTISITPINGTCTQSVDVQSVYAAYHGRDISGYGDAFAYPRQLARFEILDCQKATATLKFHGFTFGSGYSLRFYGPAAPGDPSSMGWYDFSTHATRIAPDTWQLTLENGQFGSYRPATANSILFEGGPAFANGIFHNGFD